MRNCNGVNLLHEKFCFNYNIKRELYKNKIKKNPNIYDIYSLILKP